MGSGFLEGIVAHPVKETRHRNLHSSQNPSLHISFEKLLGYADWLVHFPKIVQVSYRNLPREYHVLERHIESCNLCVWRLNTMQRLLRRLMK